MLLDRALASAHAGSPLAKRQLLVALRCDPPLSAVTYSFISRRDDNRRLVSIMKRPLLEDVDFRVQNPLWDY